MATEQTLDDIESNTQPSVTPEDVSSKDDLLDQFYDEHLVEEYHELRMGLIHRNRTDWQRLPDRNDHHESNQFCQFCCQSIIVGDEGTEFGHDSDLVGLHGYPWKGCPFAEEYDRDDVLRELYDEHIVNNKPALKDRLERLERSNGTIPPMEADKPREKFCTFCCARLTRGNDGQEFGHMRRSFEKHGFEWNQCPFCCERGDLDDV